MGETRISREDELTTNTAVLAWAFIFAGSWLKERSHHWPLSVLPLSTCLCWEELGEGEKAATAALVPKISLPPWTQVRFL